MRTTTGIFLVLSVLHASLAHAVQALSATTLNQYCENFAQDAGSMPSQMCVAYVGGFLDGAVATDARVAENVVEELESDETYSKRALRTRIFAIMRDQGPSVCENFCVGDPVPIKAVVLRVVADLNHSHTLHDATARQIVCASLMKHYPCK